MQVTVTKFKKDKKTGEYYWVDRVEERDYSKTEGRHRPLCVACESETYPKYRENCPNGGEKTD